MMKKILLIGFVLASVMAMGSCDYDDSNDLDVITPNDSTETGIVLNNKTL
jgi:hypothetical protein